MAVNSNRKGKVGELELSHVLQKYGYDTRRGQQYCGLKGNADVVGIDGMHIECKRTERGHGCNYEWLTQAKNDARDDELPVVMHRANRKEWLATMSLDDFMYLWQLAEKYKRYIIDNK